MFRTSPSTCTRKALRRMAAPVADAGRHHQDQQLGRLGAGLPPGTDRTVPNMNCPGQGTDTGTNADLFFFTLFNQPNYLDLYNNGGTAGATRAAEQLPVQVLRRHAQLEPGAAGAVRRHVPVPQRHRACDPTTGKPTGDQLHDLRCESRLGPTARLIRTGTARRCCPPGKYVVEVVVPPGYELVKEEDKNILIGDNYIAPVTQQFGGLGNIFILPDQARCQRYRLLQRQQRRRIRPQTLGRTTLPSHEGDTGSVETVLAVRGRSRASFPTTSACSRSRSEVAPFAGATRHLCDRKEVTLDDQASALAKFCIFTSTHVAAHFTGVITDDFTSEFDPFSPQFGEKFSPPNLPVSIKDWTGNEISRVYSDQWGTYNGLTYSTWEVNPPNPTGYAPTMMVTCMNDPGTGPTPGSACTTRPTASSATRFRSCRGRPSTSTRRLCRRRPSRARATTIPTAPTRMPRRRSAKWTSDGSRTLGQRGRRHTLTITALGDQPVTNNAYSGPSATTAPFNLKTVTRHYGFGATARAPCTLVGTDRRSAPADRSSSWSDTTDHGARCPRACRTAPIQQQAQYGGSTAQCGAAGHHGGQRQAVDRHGDRHDRRQGADPRRRQRQHPDRDRRRRAGRPAHRRSDLHDHGRRPWRARLPARPTRRRRTRKCC